MSTCMGCLEDFDDDDLVWENGLVCKSCESISYSELAELTHETQVYRFGWCSCEDSEPHQYPYSDCPTTGENK
jgi:hypothetical protein